MHILQRPHSQNQMTVEEEKAQRLGLECFLAIY